MELLTSTKSDYLLNGSIETLHQQSNEWINEIQFWRDELAFFYALTVKKTLKGVPEKMKAIAEESEKEMIKLTGGELDNLLEKVLRHENSLSLVLDNKYEDEQSYREKHKHLAAKISEFEQRFKLLKKEVFKLIAYIDESLNETINSIYERRAVRKYKDKIVDKSLIEKIIDAGRMAPSAINKQPWKFYVLTNKNDIKSFSKEIANIAEQHFHLSHGVNIFKTDDPVFYNAPVVIFLTTPKKDDWGLIDIGLCAQNMMLAAKSYGLDTCPVGFAKFVEQTSIYPKLNIPNTEQVDLAIVVGYGNETPTIHERNKNNVVFL